MPTHHLRSFGELSEKSFFLSVRTFVRSFVRTFVCPGCDQLLPDGLAYCNFQGLFFEVSRTVFPMERLDFTTQNYDVSKDSFST